MSRITPNQINQSTARILGRTTASTGATEQLTGTQATAMLDVMTSALKGLAPASGGGTANFLRADGTWVAAGQLAGNNAWTGSNTYSGTNPQVRLFGDGSSYYPGIFLNHLGQTLDTEAVNITCYNGGSSLAALRFVVPDNSHFIFDIGATTYGDWNETGLTVTGGVTATSITTDTVSSSGGNSLDLIGSFDINLQLTGGTVIIPAKASGNTGMEIKSAASTTAFIDFDTGGTYRGGVSYTNGQGLGLYSMAGVKLNAATGNTSVLSVNNVTVLSAASTGVTITGLLLTTASATGSAGLRLPHGAAPSSPTNGDIWTTTAGTFHRINGATKTVAFTDSNITGSAGSVGSSVTWNNSGSGAASGATFNGSSAVTVSYNTIGAAPTASPTFTGTVSSGAITASGQIQNTTAGSATTGAGQLYLNGATSNRIDFNGNGSAAPAFTTRSAGTKIVLNAALSGSAVDVAIGVQGASMWQSVPTTAATFQWYLGNSAYMELANTNLNLMTNVIKFNSDSYKQLGHVNSGTFIGYNANSDGALKHSNLDTATAALFGPTTIQFFAKSSAAAGTAIATPTMTVGNSSVTVMQLTLSGDVINATTGVYLQYNGSSKLATTSTGISVTGDVALSGNINNGPSPYSLQIGGTVKLGINSASVDLGSGVKLNTVATATGAAGLNLPHGTAPSSPTNGDVWTTTAGMYARINGATVGPFGSGGGTTTNALTINNGGSGAASGSTFNGSSAVTISHNSIGAAALSGTNNFSGTQNITGAMSLSGASNGFFFSDRDGSGQIQLFNNGDAINFHNGTATTAYLTAAGALNLSASITLSGGGEQQVTFNTAGAYFYGNATNMGMYKASGGHFYMDLATGNLNANGSLFVGTNITAGGYLAGDSTRYDAGDPNFILAKWTGTVQTVIQRVDGSNFYILLSDANSGLNGTWNAYRPLTIGLGDGVLSSANGQIFGGGTQVTGSLDLTTNTAALRFKDTGGSTPYISCQSDNNFVFYSTDAAGGSRPIWNNIARNSTSPFSIVVPTEISSTLKVSSNSSLGHTGTPDDKVHVRGDSSSGTTGIIVQNRATTAPRAAVRFITNSFDLADNRYAMVSSSGGSSANLEFWTSNGSTPTNHMTLAAAGNLILEPAGSTTVATLTMQGTTMNYIACNTTGVAVPAFTTRSVGTKFVLYPNVSGSTTDFAFGIESGSMWATVNNTSGSFKWYGGTTLAATLTGAGAFTAVGDVTAFSDITLKENIETIPNALAAVCGMRGVSFRRTDTGEISSGVIAQEFEEIAPELVHDNDGIKSVAYGNTAGYFIEAIKELKGEVDELRAELARLKGAE